MGFDFIVILPLLPCHWGFSFVFGCGVYFLVSSSVFLLMIVQQLAVIPVLSQEGVSAHPSTLPSWTNLNLILLKIVKSYRTCSLTLASPFLSPSFCWLLSKVNSEIHFQLGYFTHKPYSVDYFPICLTLCYNSKAHVVLILHIYIYTHTHTYTRYTHVHLCELNISIYLYCIYLEVFVSIYISPPIVELEDRELFCTIYFP